MTPLGMRILLEQNPARKLVRSWQKRGVALLLLALVLCFTGCASLAPEPVGPPPQFCIIRKADHKCWFDQASGKGIDIDNLESFYAVSPDDLSSLAHRLSVCHELGDQK